jgi:hypothetical protein
MSSSSRSVRLYWFLPHRVTCRCRSSTLVLPVSSRCAAPCRIVTRIYRFSFGPPDASAERRGSRGRSVEPGFRQRWPCQREEHWPRSWIAPCGLHRCTARKMSLRRPSIVQLAPSRPCASRCGSSAQKFAAMSASCKRAQSATVRLASLRSVGAKCDER